MTDTLAQLIDKLQATLGDDGTLFTDAMCTAAVRLALNAFNLAAPIHAADLVEVEDGAFEYEIETDEGAHILQVLDVLLRGMDALAENHKPLDFKSHFEDDRPFIRLTSPLSAGTLIIRYTLPHIISGLDGETESTLAPLFDTVIIQGAAYFACLNRAARRVEAINLNKEVTQPWQDLADRYKRHFEAGLKAAARKRSPAYPRRQGWDDAWHGWM
jgi:hypothetical protein